MTDHRVGPAPATPDERDEQITELEWAFDRADKQVQRVTAERDEARAALATAEAERDAAAKVADDALEILDRLAAFGLHPEKQGDLYEKVAALRRALSVEATGTEGGGGHEVKAVIQAEADRMNFVGDTEGAAVLLDALSLIARRVGGGGGGGQ
jgi:c-di-AMP phosphodiesterase-like protein